MSPALHCLHLGLLVGMCYVMLCSFLCLNCFQNCSKLFLGGSTEDSIPVVYYCAVSTLQSKHQGAITDIKWLPTTFKVGMRDGWEITLYVTL